MKASDILVKALENEGVKYIFGIPGEENLDFLESLRHSSIKLILTRHEQAAGFMAATYGRLTGKAGVCLSTLGPGATNFMTAAAYAQLGAMPMLMISGQKPINASKQGRFQIIDVVGMMEPVTKMSKQIINGGQIPSLVRAAFRLAEQERPGAVHLELPEDVAFEDVLNVKFIKTNQMFKPRASRVAMELAAERIESAKFPLMLIGAGANRKRVFDPLKKFIANTRIPFFNTQMGKGVVSCENRMFLGTAALSEGDILHESIMSADLIINIGHDVVEKPPFFMEHGGFEVIHINYSAADIDEVYFPQHEIVGDIADTISYLAERFTGGLRHESQNILSMRKKIRQTLHAKDDDPSFPMLPQRIVSDVRKSLKKDGIIALDNGMFKIWFARHYHTYQSNTVLLDNALATMGAGLPSAISCCLIHPERQVIAVCGDGGFMMNSQELETAVRLGINLIVIVINDNAYGMIRWKQGQQSFPDFGLTYNNPAFDLYANSYGAKGHTITSADELKPLIERSFLEGGVHLIEVPIDYKENANLLNNNE